MRTVRSILVLLLCLFLGGPLLAGEAENWLNRSIQYHDPGGAWAASAWSFEITESRPNGADRKTALRIGPGGEDFAWITERDGRRLEGRLDESGCVLRLDGSEEISDADRERFRLNCDRLRWLRDYYGYLWGLPMKLRDPGTVLDPEVARVQVGGRDRVALRVTYRAGVGEDTWYFYLDPDTAALAAYRFYHDEEKGDGELILLEGEVEAAGVRIPKKRTWFTNAEHRLLGTDTLERMQPADPAAPLW